VNVPDDTIDPARPPARIELHAARAGHLNDATPAGVVGARRIREFVATLGHDDLLICLVSGGGSALLPAPAAGVKLEDKRTLVALMQSLGATIEEVNCVRKHLSELKGGGLVGATKAGRIVSLIISDVMNDPLDVIASGPTVADPTTFDMALDIVEKYGLATRDGPRSAINALRAGASGSRKETLKTLPPHVTNIVIGNNATAVRAAARTAEVLGYTAQSSTAPIGGPTPQVAHDVAAFIELTKRKAVKRGSKKRICFISGGETTVELGAAPGEGGRNQEFVLTVLSLLGTRRMAGVVVLAGGTDGEDGNTRAAGAIADLRVTRKAARLGLRPKAYLELHDSNAFFTKAGGLLTTGPTGTNVMDLRIVIVDPANVQSADASAN
jgi:hydroxypyruvate reductase/glycerate 2-kinase